MYYTLLPLPRSSEGVSTEEPRPNDCGSTEEVQVFVRGLYIQHGLPQGPGETHAHPHWGETLHLSTVWQGLQSVGQAEGPRTHPQWHEALQVHVV